MLTRCLFFFEAALSLFLSSSNERSLTAYQLWTLFIYSRTNRPIQQCIPRNIRLGLSIVPSVHTVSPGSTSRRCQQVSQASWLQTVMHHHATLYSVSAIPSSVWLMRDSEKASSTDRPYIMAWESAWVSSLEGENDTAKVLYEVCAPRPPRSVRR